MHSDPEGECQAILWLETVSLNTIHVQLVSA
jgi:hypothetical protein